MSWSVEEEYPCGYKMKICSGPFGGCDFEWDNEDGCPIHGKNCPDKNEDLE